MKVLFRLLLCLCWSLLMVNYVCRGDSGVGLMVARDYAVFGGIPSDAGRTNIAAARNVASLPQRFRARTVNATRACDTVVCPGKMKCLERNGAPRCTCKFRCSRDLRRGGPVCGSDGRTFSSLCSLRRYNCRATQGAIRFVRSGNCFDTIRQQAGKKGYGIVSTLARNQGDSRSRLLRKFPFKTQSIHNHYGTGGKQGQVMCDSLTCPRKQVCQERKGGARCTCKYPCTPITRRIGPVCGSDGRTYRSLCYLYRSDCKTEAQDIYYQKPTSCEVEFEQDRNKPVPVITKNDLPSEFSIPTPKPGTLEDLAFTAPKHMQSDLISKLLRYRIQQTIYRRKLRRGLEKNKTT